MKEFHDACMSYIAQNESTGNYIFGLTYGIPKIACKKMKGNFACISEIVVENGEKVRQAFEQNNAEFKNGDEYEFANNGIATLALKESVFGYGRSEPLKAREFKAIPIMEYVRSFKTQTEAAEKLGMAQPNLYSLMIKKTAVVINDRIFVEKGKNIDGRANNKGRGSVHGITEMEIGDVKHYDNKESFERARSAAYVYTTRSDCKFHCSTINLTIERIK